MTSTRGRSAAKDAASVPVTALKGVGPRVAERLETLGIRNVEDLLFHLPSRYEDRTRVRPIGTLRPGERVAVEAEVQLSEVRYGRRRTLLVRVADGTGSLTLRFFHFSAAQREAMERGRRLRCFGEVRRGAATLEMVHPEYEYPADAAAPVGSDHLTPVYPATEGVKQPTLRRLAGQAVDALAQGSVRLQQLLPEEMLRSGGLPSLRQSLLFLHRVPPDASTAVLGENRHPAQRLLALEELTAHQLSLRQLRHRVRRHRSHAIAQSSDLVPRFIASLPFKLTGAQRRVCEEIMADLGRSEPMLRLVQGDVGSGKTAVAAIAALAAVEAGCQAAVMAPTELLSEQHYRKFRDWLAPLGIDVAWLSGRLKGAARGEVLEAVASGSTPLVVGTHALFQDDVVFNALGLTVVDEQHRFGVHQRLALRRKGDREGRRPHQLIMTATPIPRTLAMTAYADLDCSVIDELPPGRTPVETVVVPDTRRDEVVRRVREACLEGRQAYWVCTLIEESESLQAQAAEDTAALLGEAFPELRVGLVHGRLRAEEKAAVMDGFAAGALDLLVATTVIEVGVDVPNASLMIIENAERLGLAQLHQLRGRVGRGSAKSSCVLMYHGALSETARFRLSAMRETNDGFEIARRDLALRGPGEVLGTRQTGLLQFRVADLERDRDLIDTAAAWADRLLQDHPERVEPLVSRWLRQSEHYGDV